MEILTPARTALGSDLLNAVPALISYVNTGLELQYGNAAFLKFHRATVEDILHRQLAEVIGQDMYSALQDNIRKALIGEKTCREILIENEHEAILFEVTLVPDLDPGGPVKGCTFFAVQLPDKTRELFQMQSEFRKSEERYHKMLDEVQDYAIILLDMEGNIVDWNKGAEKIKGYTAAEIIGQNFRIFYTAEDRESKLAERLIQEAREKGKANHEGWRVKKDGTRFWGAVVITALHDENNEIIGFSKVTRDLTERKIAEDKQKQNAEQLEAQNKELEQFAYVASHDLQEPLRKIRTFNSLIIEHESDKLSEKGRDYFSRSIAAADRMNKLIDDLLTYSRATRDAHQMENVDLNMVLARVRSSFKDSDRAVIIEADDLPVMMGMRFQFEQLFDNLISNGIKYQPEGNTPHIRVNYQLVAGNEIKGKGFAAASMFHQITFTDNGIGFEQQYAEKIFEMFHRLHGRSEYSGSGIGLAVVKKIVQNYGGFITAEGRPGEGATFNLYFPV